ncbi:MAG: sugar kinase [Verrucomicrobiae bacterium]|nr:sugar kinase [Verrucomicrobiae bacterium]
MPYDVVTFGEIMLRLTPPGFQRILQTSVFEVRYGGGEANVAVSLAMLGRPVAFVTRLPKNDVAQRCINELRAVGVDTSRILRGGERMGIYFLEAGASQRPSTVLYDRAHSAIAGITPDMVDWKAVFAGAKWFHFTGITPALSDSAAETCRAAARTAREMGLTVSVDLNYRKKLWSREKAGAVMGGLMSYADLCIANEEDAESVFGIKGAEVASGKIEQARYVDVARQLTERFQFKGVAITLRESLSASENGWSGLYYVGGHAHFSRRYHIHVVDRVGGGDSFAAGLIFALLRGDEPQKAVEFAAAASCLKHSVVGDFNYVTLNEVEALAAGDASGRVQR